MEKGFDFIDRREMRKSSSRNVLEAIIYMSNYLAKKSLDSPEFEDLETKAYRYMASDLYDNPRNLDEIFILNDFLIGIPNNKPEKNFQTGARKSGITVVPLVHIPGKQPEYAWKSNGVTYKEKFDLSLRGGRTMSIHSVIPGMKVSFHFFEYMDGFKQRTSIVGKLIDYDEDNNIRIIDIPEADVAVRMPEWEDNL